ncbi:DUF488 family protein [Spirosoma utsteinense]|uniref:DUF488 domain-containing protein n=2 Tax=Spirosoma utsteinense TaxID=2585773 RepID=A0ABR6W3H3_9BACT|nr:DUF488 domain-containing protein [Spirosoma utsteinense]MBC3786649.1 putative protein YwgA [Spirosoma utsteinense]MBC3791012.1 putative protein YwgA [Spirosoma utsteinense]
MIIAKFANMMYYRRKILLALLQAFDGQLGKTDLQKLLLIVTKLQPKPSFDFVPHRFGCYSYQSSWDLRALKAYGIVAESDHGWEIIKVEDYRGMLVEDDKSRINHVARAYKDYNTDQLTKATYIEFPYYAIRSEKASKLLNKEELKVIEKYIPIDEEKSLFTIGYEGLNVESYFNKLIRNNVKVLCDVRRNALSQKVGFSKSTLSSVCESLGIMYVHIPSLGIPSEKRQNLKTQKDYDVLFADFESTYLVNQTSKLYSILSLLNIHKRVALTCFEASPCQCHRSKVAKGITELPEWSYKLKHL